VITYDEIRDKSDEFDIHTSDVQRDYVFGWLVACIADDSMLGRDLTLKGGNAFRKAYFPSTRFSDDLDYSSEHG
jgi:predicted nucleotidyltransferase component of viral defense system